MSRRCIPGCDAVSCHVVGYLDVVGCFNTFNRALCIEASNDMQALSCRWMLQNLQSGTIQRHDNASIPPIRHYFLCLSTCSVVDPLTALSIHLPPPWPTLALLFSRFRSRSRSRSCSLSRKTASDLFGLLFDLLSHTCL